MKINLPFFNKVVNIDRKEVLCKLMINLITEISDDEDKLNNMYSVMIDKACEMDKEEVKVDTSTTIEKVIYSIEKLLGIDKDFDQEKLVSELSIYISNPFITIAYIPIILIIVYVFTHKLH